MKQLKNTPWFLLLLVVFFVVHGSVENFEFLYFTEVMKIGAAILGFVALFFLITRLFIKNNVHAALVCFFISAWILFYGAIFGWIRSIQVLHFLHSYTVFVPLMLCIFIGFIFFIRKKKLLQSKLCFYLNVLLLVYCLYDLSTLAFKWAGADKKKTVSNISFNAGVVKAKPNVYLLLFDEYPGYQSLKDSFAFANDSLYQFLEKKDFKFMPTFSNYNMTFYSMASMLNMNYISNTYQPLANTIDDDQQRLKEIKTAQAVKYFESMGYSFTNYSIFDILDQPSVKGNSFVVSQATLLTHKIFFNKMLKDIGWHFITGKYKIPFIENLFLKDDRNNKFIEKKLLETKADTASAPKFVYAHFNMPHPPIFCDSVGNYLSNAQIFNEELYEQRPFFLSYLKYANTKIKNLVQVICNNDPNAIVIVMSDHGYRGYNHGLVFNPLYFDNICAVRFPDKNYLPVKEKWSNVNFFRYLFNCQFNQQIPYLPDSSIFLKDKIVAE